MICIHIPLTLALGLYMFGPLDEDDDDDDEESPMMCVGNIVMFSVLSLILVPLDIVCLPFNLCIAGGMICGGCDRETDSCYIHMM